MGHSVLAFSQLAAIEKLLWSDFRNEISGNHRWNSFVKLFENSKLYPSYLAIANRPIPIEPLMIVMMFYHYNMLVNIDNSRNNYDLNNEIVTCEIRVPNVKELFDKSIERCPDLINSFYQKEGEYLLRMFFERSNDLDDKATKLGLEKDSEFNSSLIFFFCLLLQNQKLMQKINESKFNSNIYPEDVLIDYTDWTAVQVYSLSIE